jgi:hypothetical protein
MKTQRVGLLLLLVGMLMVLGCEDKGVEYVPCNDCPGPGLAIMIFMPTDTLTFLPGDTANVNGWIVVTDGTGRAYPGLPVSISLLDPIGVITLLDSALQDTSNDSGRVYFRYQSINQTGTTTIRAAVGNHVDLWPLTVLPQRVRFDSLSLHLSRDTLRVAPNEEDSVWVTVTGVGRYDSTEQGVPRIVVPVRADGGRLSPIGPTDTTGTASTWWHSNGEYGLFHIWVAIDTIRVVDSVLVLLVAR